MEASSSDSEPDFELEESASEADSETGSAFGSAVSDVEMNESPAESVMDVTVEEEMQIDEDDLGVDKRFQKDNWRFKFLPYYNELIREADNEFSTIKTLLAKGILERDLRPGFTVAIKSLLEFVNMYGKRFTKTDHIQMVKLLYNVLILKGLDFRVVRMVAASLNTLMNHKILLTREDLHVDWKPLYELYNEIAFKKLEEDGLILFPEGLKEKVEAAIINLTEFFEDGATQEILDLIRPGICPLDDSVTQAFSTARVFLPTCMKPEHHEAFGAKLWFDEFYHWFSCGELNDTNEARILGVLVQLSVDCPFFIDWTEKWDLIFDRLMQSCGLNVSQTSLGTDLQGVQLIAILIAYNLGGRNDLLQDKLTSLFQSWEDFFHPSNSGDHLNQLLVFVAKLVTNVTARVSRERHFQKKYYVRIPSDRCITDAQLDMFVKSLLPCLNYAAFAKTKQDVARIFRYCAFLAPGIVLPQLLDLVYPALENITEPHRLHQTLDIFMQVLVPLARDEPTPGRERFSLKLFEDAGINDKSLRCHFITILNNILPGVDVNDVTKSAMTFQIIATIFCLMPVVDCSEAIHVRDDLTEEEQELCRATAGFESLIDQILQKCFSIIEANSAACHLSNTHPFNMEQVQKTTEEVFNERGIYVVIKQLTKNCSSAIFDYAMNSFFEFMKDRIFDTRTAVDSVCRIMIIFITAKPKVAFKRFFEYAWGKLQSLISPTSVNEEELSHGLLWFITMTCETLNRVRGDVILEHKDLILPALETLLSFTCRDAYLRACAALENVIGMLVSIYPDMDEHYMNVNDQPFDKYLPIRNWAKVVKKNDWVMKWHVPSKEEVDFAEELLNRFLFPSLDILKNPGQLGDKQMQKFLHIVQNCVSGASSLLPFFDGEPINFFPYGKPQPILTCTAMPDYVHRLTAPDGSNLRRVVYDDIKQLTHYILEHKKNDTKSLRVVIQILCNLLVCEGIDPTHYVIKATHHAMRKRIFNDPIRGHTMILETALEEGIYFIHQRRQFHRPMAIMTELHGDAMSLLVTLGTSLYADTRVRAQQVLEFCLSQVPYSYKIILDQVLSIIANQRNVSHEEFKGALYILINGKKTSICLKQDWPTLLKVWPIILRAQHSEKSSIIDMFDFIVQTVSQSFESFYISYIVPDHLTTYALKLLDDYEGNVHKVLMGPPTEEDISNAKAFEARVNEENLNNYRSLCQSLYSICVDRDLHWRHTDMAQSFMALMFRRDIPVPDEIVKLFTRLLVSDTLNTRKSALSVITSWQKIVKIRSIKKVYPINVKLPNVGPGAKWPIQYGLREDNFQLIKDMDTELKNKEEYDNTSYFTKWHIGFYTWPEEFKVLAPPNEQVHGNREVSDLSPLEKEVLGIFSEPGFMDKLIGFYSMEEKKGSDSFVEMNYHLFYRLFRNLGPSIWPLVEPHLDKLLASKKEGEQRLASEIVSGLLTATKLWKYERVYPIVTWLQPRLLRCLETVTDEAENNWCAAMAIIFCRMDIRQIQWIYNIIVDLVSKSHDSGFHTIFRLKVLHSCIVQYEWRVPRLLRDFFRQCVLLASRNSQLLRVRVGSALASCTTPCVYGMHIYQNIPSDLYPIRNADVISVINRELLENVWKEVLTNGFDELNLIWKTDLSDSIPRILTGNSSPDSPPPLSRSTSIEPAKEDGDKVDDGTSASVSARTSSGSKTPRSIKSHLRRASTPPVSIPKSGKPEMGRKREKAMLITLANTIYSSWAISSAHQLMASFELLPLFAHFANDPLDDELSTTCEELLLGEMGCTPVDPALADHILKVVRLTVTNSCTWKTRCSIIRFLQVHIFANIYVYKNLFVDRIREILDILLLDQQFEVRINAGLTLSGFIQCGLFTVDAHFLNTFNEWSESQDMIRRHAGVLALSAVVTAAPYKVPSYTPDVLMQICRHLRDPQPIYPTVKRTLNEFRRTHLDCWKDHKNQFNEDQLTVLTNLLVSPTYYV